MLAPGTRLGSFEILAPLGAGGMGEVYRARDSRLSREVAIKVLPADLAHDSGRLMRFEREARGVSALQHPAIVTIYEVGEENALPFLVMELVAGKTLTETLSGGPLPSRRLLVIATQVAEGLAAAHEAGIVHRDLKPDNIMISRDGQAKILDFGLAKLSRKALDQDEKGQATLAPTEPGELLGTVGYMSPEQAAGQPADFRSDQFALGAILYEMATGRRAFRGDTAVDTLSAILHQDPKPLAALQPEHAAPFSWIVERCLAKDPASRYHSTADLARDLADLRDRTASGAQLPASLSRRARPADGWIGLVWATTAAAIAVAVTLAIVAWRERSAPRLQVKFVFPVPPEARMETVGSAIKSHSIAVAPDGTSIVFVALSDGVPRLWIRPLDSPVAREVPGTEGATSPFWSPDGTSLAFFADRKLKRMAMPGGPAQSLCGVATDDVTGTWSESGTILFADGPLWSNRVLYSVPATGGEPVRVSRGAAWEGWDGLRWPRFLPGSDRFLTIARHAWDDETFLLAGALDSGSLTVVAPFTSRVEIDASWNLYFVSEGTLVRQRFHGSRLRLLGGRVPLATRLPYHAGAAWAPFSVSRNGVVAYQTAGEPVPLRWVDRSGNVVGSVGAAAFYGTFRLSPDGERVMAEKHVAESGASDLWIEELSRGVETRFTAGDRLATWPTWSPDAATLAFATGDLVVRKLADPGPGETILASGRCDGPTPLDWSPDGHTLLYSQACPDTNFDLMLLPLAAPRQSIPFRRTRFNEGNNGAAFSPDGKWIAYLSDASGQVEAYVAPLAGGSEVRISTAGAALEPPRWRRDGGELFYVAADRMLTSVAIRYERGRLEPGAPVPLFPLGTGVGNSYDAAPDGRRFLVNSGRSPEQSPITVVLDAETR